MIKRLWLVVILALRQAAGERAWLECGAEPGLKRHPGPRRAKYSGRSGSSISITSLLFPAPSGVADERKRSLFGTIVASRCCSGRVEKTGMARTRRRLRPG